MTTKENDKRDLLATLEDLKVRVESLATDASPHMDPATNPAMIRSILDARESRKRYFSPKLFGEPAWDMLLQLYAVELEHDRISVYHLCLASGVSQTTALRWIAKLENEGLVCREPDAFDRRRSWMQLTPVGKDLLCRFLADVMSTRLAPM